MSIYIRIYKHTQCIYIYIYVCIYVYINVYRGTYGVERLPFRRKKSSCLATVFGEKIICEKAKGTLTIMIFFLMVYTYLFC